MGEARRHSRRESGQAAVEAALTLPLTVFLILGTLQLFLMMQGRLLAEYAAFRAARVGSVRHGECVPMVHAAVAALLPSFHSFMQPQFGGPGATPGQKLAEAFRRRTQGVGPEIARYDSGTGIGEDGPHSGAIVWLFREQPTRNSVLATNPEDNFDNPEFTDPGLAAAAAASGAQLGGFAGYRLELRLVYWFPMKIPFANWVMATMFRAHYGLAPYTYQNPLLLSETANWQAANGASFRSAQIADEFITRYNSGQYAFPIEATYSMRMMTPPRPSAFPQQHCTPVPP